ncbi:MAG: FAD-dependent oxidoreductase [Planctomycetota bacterium]
MNTINHEPVLRRDLARAADAEFDLVVIGAGVYGVMTTLEAARRGLSVCLIDAQDFNAGVSFHSLRILHGGLRYLQSMDLPRFFESVSERRWFFRHFPEQCEVLPCLMPLYGEGLKRPSTFRVAMAMNDALSFRRNAGVSADIHLPGGKVLGPQDTARRFPTVRQEGLRGAGCWPDGRMRCHQRLMIEMLRWAASCGALALNYVRAEGLRVEAGRVTGVQATDVLTGQALTISTTRVMNTAGPACRALAERWHADTPALFRPTLAFNLLLDVDPPSDHAVAVAPPKKDARTFFVTPWHGRTFAGTYHTEHADTVKRGAPSTELVAEMLLGLREAIPGWSPMPSDVARVHAGRLPGDPGGGDDAAHRAVRVDHGKIGGPHGLYTVSGVKYTTAGLEARRGLRLAWGYSLPDMQEKRKRPEVGAPVDACAAPGGFDLDLAVRLAEQESAVCLEDVVCRRADWAPDDRSAESAMAQLGLRLDLPRSISTPEPGDSEEHA